MKKKKKKEIKQKSFFFKDYSESEIVFNNLDNKIIQISPSRVTFLFFIFISLVFIFSIKITYLSLFPEKNYLLEKSNQNFTKHRADIVDRNGKILARSIKIYSAGVRTKLVQDKKKLLINLKLIFPDFDVDDFEKKFKKKEFFYIKKRLTDDEKTKLWLIGNKAIVFEKKQYRIYPQQNLLSHVLGQTDDNNNGISGLEKFFDNDLKNEKFINSTFELTLDSNLQHLIREELISAKEIFGQIGSAAILMNINNGEILSLVSLPDYDLNKRFSITDDVYTNKITKGIYELGSVFKTFTVAAGLENNVVQSNTVFENLENEIYCAGRKISEHDKLPKDLSVEQILIRSSNIGSVRIAQKIGIEKYKDFLNSLELFQTIKFDLEEVGSPLSFKWGKCKLATASFGHGITTTPLQLSKAYAILNNGGYKIEPTIVKKNKISIKKEKIISEKTSRTISKILRKVVSNKEGTANFANVQGYEVGGKTGTALKSINGTYSEKKINTFVSIFPSSKPQYVLLVILDEPKSAPNYVYKFPNGYKHKGESCGRSIEKQSGSYHWGCTRNRREKC